MTSTSAAQPHNDPEGTLHTSTEQADLPVTLLEIEDAFGFCGLDGDCA